MNGKIKNVNSRGYGFIETDTKIDWYFHHTQFQGNWKVLLARYVNGDTTHVEFENDPTAKDGPRALNVKMINEATK